MTGTTIWTTAAYRLFNVLDDFNREVPSIAGSVAAARDQGY